jgi:hypothetical protein
MDGCMDNGLSVEDDDRQDLPASSAALPLHFDLTGG